MIDLVVFDMAGTTIDDHGLVYVALAECVGETGASIDDRTLQTWMGTDKVQAITALLSLGGVDPNPARVQAVFARFLQILRASYTRTPPVALSGVEETLTTLRSRGIKTSLSTGFSEDVAMPILESLGWTIGEGDTDLLHAVITTTDVASGRPAPYLIHHAMEATGVQDVRRVLAAGDTIVDLLAARNAGVIAVGVTTGKLGRSDLEAHPHDHVLDTLAEVLELAVVTDED